MDQHDDAAHHDYPHGRGYGHDYMRGGEVLGGYGYADREEYQTPRGELRGAGTESRDASDQDGAINIRQWPIAGLYQPDAIDVIEEAQQDLAAL